MGPNKSSVNGGQQGHHQRSQIGKQGHPNIDDFPFQLDDSNDYPEWRRRMIIKLQKLNLWDIMTTEFTYEEESTPGWIKKNNQAVAAIDAFMSDDIAAYTTDFERAADIWQALEIQLWDSKQPNFWEDDILLESKDSYENDPDHASITDPTESSDDVAGEDVINNQRAIVANIYQCATVADNLPIINKNSVIDNHSINNDSRVLDKFANHTKNIAQETLDRKFSDSKVDQTASAIHDLKTQSLVVGKGAKFKMLLKGAKAKKPNKGTKFKMLKGGAGVKLCGHQAKYIRNQASYDWPDSSGGLFKKRPPREIETRNSTTRIPNSKFQVCVNSSHVSRSAEFSVGVRGRSVSY
jgi:hypothetical protein